MGLRLSPGNCCGPVERCLFNGVPNRTVVNELCALDFRERSGNDPVPLPYIAGPGGVVDLSKPVKSGVLTTVTLRNTITPGQPHESNETRQYNIDTNYVNVKHYIHAGTYRYSYAYLYFYGVVAATTAPGYEIKNAIFPVDEQTGTAQGWEEDIDAIGYLKCSCAFCVYEFNRAKYTNPECLFSFCTCRLYNQEGTTVEEIWQNRRAGVIVPYPTDPADYTPDMLTPAEGGGRYIVYGDTNGCLSHVTFAPTPPATIDVPFGVYACEPEIVYTSTDSPVSLGNSTISITRTGFVAGLQLWHLHFLVIEITYSVSEAITAVTTDPCGERNKLPYNTGAPLYRTEQAYAIWDPITDRTDRQIPFESDNTRDGAYAANESGISRLIAAINQNTFGPHEIKVYANTRECSTLSEAEAVAAAFASEADSFVGTLELRHAGRSGGITTKSIDTPGTINPCVFGSGLRSFAASTAAPMAVGAGAMTLASSAAPTTGLCLHAVPTGTAWAGCTTCRVYECHNPVMGLATNFGGLPVGKINEVPGETFYNVRSGFCNCNYCSLYEPR